MVRVGLAPLVTKIQDSQCHIQNTQRQVQRFLNITSKDFSSPPKMARLMVIANTVVTCLAIWIGFVLTIVSLLRMSADTTTNFSLWGWERFFRRTGAVSGYL